MGELARSSWGASLGFGTLHEVVAVLIAAAVLALVAFTVARAGLRALPTDSRGWGQRGLTLLETIIVLLIVAVVVLAIFVLA